MKFYVSSADLAEAMNVVSKALTNKKNIPVLEGVKIVADGDTVTLTATDLDLFIEKKIKAEIFLEGQAIVPGKFITEYSRKLSEFERIEFEKLDNHRIIIRYGDAKMETQCFEEDSYPEVISINSGESFKIKEKEIKELLEKTIFAVAVDDSRPILKGCLFETEGDKIVTVGLDGYRIAVCKKTVTDCVGVCHFIVPGRNLSEISKIFNESDNIVTVSVKENNVKFDIGHTTVISRLLEGDFVNYKNVIPKKFLTSVVVKVSELLNSLERTAVISRTKNNNSVKMIIANNQISMYADNDNASGQEVVVVKEDGEDINIAFNNKYLQDALGKITEDYAMIEFDKPTSPALIRPLEGDDYRYIILPVRQLG